MPAGNRTKVIFELSGKEATAVYKATSKIMQNGCLDITDFTKDEQEMIRRFDNTLGEAIR